MQSEPGRYGGLAVSFMRNQQGLIAGAQCRLTITYGATASLGVITPVLQVLPLNPCMHDA